jgi:hypothetical protein
MIASAMRDVKAKRVGPNSKEVVLLVLKEIGTQVSLARTWQDSHNLFS